MADNHTELPPPAYNAAPGHSPSSNEMLSPHHTHATPVSLQTTGTSQQESGYLPARPNSDYIAPPLQHPMGAAPYHSQNQTSSPSLLSSPEMQNVQPTQQPQQRSPTSEVQQAPTLYDGEMSKSEPQPEPDLQAHPALQNAKYFNEGQQPVHGQGQMDGQQEDTPYPGTTGANGAYQTAFELKDLGRVPAPVDCPRCNKRGLTEIESESGGFTNLLALTLCCCFCLGCIPYCIDGTKNVKHKCSNCKSLLAVWHRSNSKAVVAAYK